MKISQGCLKQNILLKMKNDSHNIFNSNPHGVASIALSNFEEILLKKS
jgi:hypothetical protein